MLNSKNTSKEHTAVHKTKFNSLSLSEQIEYTKVVLSKLTKYFRSEQLFHRNQRKVGKITGQIQQELGLANQTLVPNFYKQHTCVEVKNLSLIILPSNQSLGNEETFQSDFSNESLNLLPVNTLKEYLLNTLHKASKQIRDSVYKTDTAKEISDNINNKITSLERCLTTFKQQSDKKYDKIAIHDVTVELIITVKILNQ